MSRPAAALAACLLLNAAAAPLAAQVPPPSSPDPAPEAAPDPRAAEDRLEGMMWQAAATANSERAFRTYLDRYPEGAHSEDARAALDQLRRSPPLPAAAASEAPQPAVAAAPAPVAVPPVPVETRPAAAVAPGSAVAAPSLPVAVVQPAPVPVAPSPVAEAAPAAPSPSQAAATAVDHGAPFLCRPSFAGDAPYEQAGEAEITAFTQALRQNSVAAYLGYLAAYPEGAFVSEVAEVVAARQGRSAALAGLGGPGPVVARARLAVTPTAVDYPASALRDGRQGSVTATWEVADDGCVEMCRVTQSSGSAALDAASCRIVTARARYDPALDAAGRPVRSTDGATLSWRLPQH